MDAQSVSTEKLVASFADTRMPVDPTRVSQPTDGSLWPQAILDDFGHQLKPAGVLVPVLQRDEGFTVLLTVRSRQMKHHAGQVSFPGGRMEASDESIMVTALRETHEEVGIDPAAVSVIGYLQPTPTISGYAVTPAIGLIEEVPQLRLEEAEVAAAFEVPLSYLLDASIYRHSTRDYRGAQIPMLEFSHSGQRVWGATALMIDRFVKTIKNNNL